MSWWQRFQQSRWWLRVPAKWLFILVVLFVVSFPNPALFLRHVEHWKDPNGLIDPDLPELQPLAEEVRTLITPEMKPREALRTVQRFVYEHIKYEWDWVLWGSADYLPTLAETLAKGREDCDGQAVVAASLLRHLGYKAELVTDFVHVWVKTDRGETMGPRKTKSVEATEEGFVVHWKTLGQIPKSFAYGIAVFPFGREIIIALALWLVLLPTRPSWCLALILLLLLIDGLCFVRLGGVDPDKPRMAVVWAGVANVVAAFILAYTQTRPKAPAMNQPASVTGEGQR